MYLTRALKVDFAPALVGFELAAGGRMVPKLEGVVVCEVRDWEGSAQGQGGCGWEAKIRADATGVGEGLYGVVE